MKIALYVEDGLEQIVLTPQTPTEKSLLAKLNETDANMVSISKGSFYECRGGYVRQSTSDDSTILVIKRKGTPA